MMSSIDKIGITTNCSRGDSITSILQNIKAAGFFSVMLDRYNNLDQEIITAQNIGLNVESVHIDSRRINDMWEDTKAASMVIEQLTNDFKILKRNGVLTAIVHPAQNNDDFTSPAKAPSMQALHNWQKVLSQAEKLGIFVAIENVDPAHLQHLFFLLDNIKSKNLKFCYDSGHHNLFNANVDLIGKYSEILHAVHLHDNNMEFPQSPGWSGDLHLIPFDGKIDFEKIAKQIANSQFTGTTMLETSRRSKLYNEMTRAEYFNHAYTNGKKLSKLILSNRQVEQGREY